MNIRYKKPCDTISGPAGTFTTGNTGTTYDTVFSDLIASSAQVPIWWLGVMAISSGINREAIAGIGCAADYSGFQMKIANSRITDPALAHETKLFIQYCYRPAHSKFLREKPDISRLKEVFGEDDTEWIGSHIFLQTPGYYDNPAFRPREPIRGWPYETARDTEYPQPLPPGVDPANSGRPVCNDWWEHPERGLRRRILNVIEPEVLGAGLSFSSDFVFFGGTLTQEKVEDALIKDVISTTMVAAATGSEVVPSLNEEGALEFLPRLGGSLGLKWESLSFAPMMYVVRAALPIFQALILGGLYALLPFALLASRYSIQGLLMLSVAIFTVKFWSYLWHLAKWLESNLIRVLYPDWESYTQAATGWLKSHLVAGNLALKADILDFAVSLMYIVLPLIFTFLMGVVGFSAATGFASIVGALSQLVQRAGRTAADAAKTAAEGAIRGRIGK